MEGVVPDVQSSHLGVADLDALGIAVGIDVASDGQTVVGRCRGEQLDDDLVGEERLATPILRDVGKEAVLDLVPLAGARRQVGDGDGQAGLVGEALKLTFPQAYPAST